MVTQIKALVPAALEPMVIHLWYLIRPVVRFMFSGRNRYCPVCESWSRGFLSHGTLKTRKKDAVCPVCLSHERHRLAWIFLSSSAGLHDESPKKLFHVAPEPELGRKLRRLPRVEYFSADLSSPHAMEKADITKTHWPEGSFDAIYCSHVLEHVPDDRQAMRELFRVLTPGGWALIQVPISDRETIEDPTITNPAERERLFGWHDHVRYYGLDISDRLAAVGFSVEIIYGHQLVPPRDLQRMSLTSNEPLFYCRKPAV